MFTFNLAALSQNRKN